MNKLKMKARAGVTLVELLVVILIVTILSVSLLPLLKPYVIKAQYAAEPVPVIGNLRTMIGLFQYNKNYLPGLDRDTEGKVLFGVGSDGGAGMQQSLMATEARGGDSTISSGCSAIQTFVAAKATDGDLTGYFPAIFGLLTDGKKPESGNFYLKETSTSATGSTALNWTDPDGFTDSTDLVDHFAKDIQINYEDLTGRRMKPCHVQYRAIYGGAKSGSYAYVLGVFGDDNGLAAGTGYAVIEIVNPACNVKYVGTWERYKAVSTDADQITFADSTDWPVAGGGTDSLVPAKGNVCWIGNPSVTEGYLSSDASKVKNAIDDLKTAGWEF